jgi:hypothetical protein
MTPKEAALYLDHFLTEERLRLGPNSPSPNAYLTWEEKQMLNRTGRLRHTLTDFVLFSEGWWVNVLENTQQTLPLLIGDVCRKHQVYVVLGSGIEKVRNPQSGNFNFYVTSVLMGPDGKVVGWYRKQVHPGHSPSLSVGNEVGLFHTRFGRIGLLICFDIENQSIRDAILAARPWLILNPIHIPGSEFISEVKGQKKKEIEKKRNWMIQCRSMAQKFERMTREFGFVLVRCDLQHGAGTSQVRYSFYVRVCCQRRIRKVGKEEKRRKKKKKKKRKKKLKKNKKKEEKKKKKDFFLFVMLYFIN